MHNVGEKTVDREPPQSREITDVFGISRIVYSTALLDVFSKTSGVMSCHDRRDIDIVLKATLHGHMTMNIVTRRILGH